MYKVYIFVRKGLFRSAKRAYGFREFGDGGGNCSADADKYRTDEIADTGATRCEHSYENGLIEWQIRAT